MSPSAAIFQRLAGDAELVGLLSTYNGEPAVFVADDDKLPGDVTRPFIIIHGALSDDPEDCKVEPGRDRLMSVRAYDDATGSVLTVEQIAERARTLLHRQPVGLAEGAWLVSVAGPSVADTDHTLVGRQLDVRIRSLDTTS